MLIDELTDVLSGGGDFLSMVKKLYAEPRVRFRDDGFSINGEKFDYGDVCKFKVFKKGDKHYWVPLTSRFRGAKEEGRTVDLLSVVNVGVAEGFMMLNKLFDFDNYELVLRVYDYILDEYKIFDRDLEYFDLLINRGNAFEKGESTMTPFPSIHNYGLKFRFLDECGARTVDQMAQFLDCMALLNRPRYVQCLFDLLLFLATCKVFLYDVYRLKIIMSRESYKGELERLKEYDVDVYNRVSLQRAKENEKSIGRFADNVPDLGYFSVERMEYKYDGHTGYITDFGAFGTYLAGIMAFGVLSFEDHTWFDEVTTVGYCNHMLNRVLGDDMVSFLLRGRGTCGYLFSDEDVSKLERGWRKNMDVVSLRYESFVVWKRGTCSKLEFKDMRECYIRCVTYDIESAAVALGEIVVRQTGESDGVERVISDTLKMAVETHDEYETRKDQMSKEIRELRDKVRELKADDRIGGYEKKLSRLEEENKRLAFELEKRAKRTKELNDEVEGLRDLFDNLVLTDDDSGDDMVGSDDGESGADLAEVIAALSEKRVLVVSAYEPIKTKLENLGYTNVEVLTGIDRAAPKKLDMVVYCTRMMTHKMFFQTRDRYPDVKSVYVNTKSPESILRVAYKALRED